MKARVVLIGAGGRMGRFSAALLRESEEFELVAELGIGDDRAKALPSTGAELGLDFTVAGCGFEHGMELIEAGIRPVIGTSGVSPEENEILDRAARERELGGLVVPNFSVGMCLLQEACRLAAGSFSHCEILEMHHPAKVDAPSGTAVDTAEQIAAKRGVAVGSVPIHSVRLAGMYAHQTVIFGAAGETLTVRHDMSSPEAFGPGILAALRWAGGAVGVGRGIAPALAASR
jgi:4-hydroxy-tetrahydrodipicolinate reductase